MTILGALEQAKRMRGERARSGSTPEKPEPARGRSRELAVASAPAVALDYPRLEVNRETWGRNRVLMSAPQGTAQAHAIDSYRILRTRLRGRLSAEQFVTLGVVSSGPDEGKSVTAINMALSFANEKRRNVFLLDLDLRNPSLCRYLGVAPPVELGGVLARTAKPDDAFFTVGVDNLAVAGNLSTHDNSSEVLGSSALGDLFEHIRSKDPGALVVVDLPPLLQSADSMVVAPQLTSVLLVVGEGIARREQLNRAAELLAGVNVAGVVLNRSREAVEEYYG